MMKQLIFKKLGNHWYLDINHENVQDLTMDPKIERYLNWLDTWDQGIVSSLYLIEESEIIIPEGLIQFLDSDITRYFTTKDEFNMKMFIGHHKFYISSNLYRLLEKTYGFNFHDTIYRISNEV